jgi:hypothetical protein
VADPSAKRSLAMTARGAPSRHWPHPASVRQRASCSDRRAPCLVRKARMAPPSASPPSSSRPLLATRPDVANTRPAASVASPGQLPSDRWGHQIRAADAARMVDLGSPAAPVIDHVEPTAVRPGDCCFAVASAIALAGAFACKRRPRSRPRTTSLPRKHSRGHGAARACLRREPQTIWLPSGSPKGAAGPLVVREGPASHGMPSGSSAGRRCRGGSG